MSSKGYYIKNKDKWAGYYEANKSREDWPVLRRKWDKSFKQRLRELILFEYGGVCVCCGETEPRFLELDHIHGLSAEEKATNRHWRKHDTFGSRLYQRAKKEGFPKDKYRLLCSNCNRGRWRNGGTCPHENQPFAISLC